jgi:hypothetical protein
MRNIVYVGIMCAGASLAVIPFPLAFGELPVATGGPNSESVKPRQPGGILSDELGAYRTIEGFRFEGGKVETGTLLVDTVDGKKLDKPITLLIRGAVVVDQNLQPAGLSLPAKQRCILKGFESGEMIGVPPAVSAAAEEQGWKEVPISQAVWRWRPYFIALVVIEPKDLELRKR